MALPSAQALVSGIFLHDRVLIRPFPVREGAPKRGSVMKQIAPLLAALFVCAMTAIASAVVAYNNGNVFLRAAVVAVGVMVALGVYHWLRQRSK